MNPPLLPLLLCRSTAQSCASSLDDPCQSHEGMGGCSVFEHLWIDGANGAGPYLFVVASTDAETGSFELEFAKSDKEN